MAAWKARLKSFPSRKPAKKKRRKNFHYEKDANKKDVDKKEEKDKITCEKSELKDLVNFTVNNNAKQEQNSTYSPLTPTKNNSSQIITTKKDNKTNECK